MSLKRKVKNLLRPILKPMFMKYREKGYEDQKQTFFDEITGTIKSKKYDAIIIFDVYFGFYVKMFQRPQHIALNLAKENILYFYKASPYVDKDIKTYKKLGENIYLVNTDLYWLQECLIDIVSQSKIPAFGQIYSTAFVEYDIWLKKFTDKNFKIIYEYVDDFADEIAGVKISDEIKESHKRMLKDSENVYVVATADKLYKEVKEVRGEKNLALVTNGVEYKHFINLSNEKIPDKIRSLVRKNKRIIGYFGALANWFDYDLIKKLANEFKDEYEIILIGIDYDSSLKKSGILDFKNVHYLGTVDYSELPKYARFFNVSIIPFKINEITKSTSPVKLFEYMALGKPIVTTDLPECRKYKSPLVSNSHEEFINSIKKATELENSKEYIDLLRKEGKENTWNAKAKAIKNLILD
ncbi:glycosyltransferase [Clostridium sp.]|uniref:glycosyltransferase n=1 Tax=Clostridium sp. TaxID=1506 RepID=UPI002632C73D|nr:glycosyltransferase [Clostridium sp.]